MATIARFGLAEAKNRLSELIDRVEQGEEITITRHEVAVARLVPARRTSLHEAQRAIEAMRLLRSANPARITPEEIRTWKNEGRP
jgi:prevent-host-death family protein